MQGNGRVGDHAGELHGDGRPGQGEPRAVVADELALVRLGIAAVLGPLGVDVIAETHSGREAASLAALESPDLVVLGALVDLPPADAVRRVRRARPAPAVVTLLPYAAGESVGLLLGYGASGLAVRAGRTEDFAIVVERVMKGEQYVTPALLGRLAGVVRPRGRTPTRRAQVQGTREGSAVALTSREREVLAFLAEGRTNREIAAALSVTLATVKSHLVHVYAKLDAANRNEALGRAVALDLLG